MRCGRRGWPTAPTSAWRTTVAPARGGRSRPAVGVAAATAARGPQRPRGTAPSVRAAVQQAEDELGDTGRILLRPSGTEQMIRVMVEADDERIAHRLATCVAETVRAQH